MFDQVEDRYHYRNHNRLGLKLIELNDNHSGVIIGALQTFAHLSAEAATKQVHEMLIGGDSKLVVGVSVCFLSLSIFLQFQCKLSSILI